jgi:hypothetical protein
MNSSPDMQPGSSHEQLMVVLSTRRADGELNQLVDFNLPKAQRPLNSTTSLSGDANVPRKFLTILA